jgi:DMSO/TMAO reductase YedYZ molybdopterin-dependent catalytic subunit
LYVELIGSEVINMQENERMTRRRFLKAMGLGLAGLSMTGFLTYLFGTSNPLKIISGGSSSSRADGFLSLQSFRINSVEDTPQTTAADYRLTMDGLVANPVKWSLDELQKKLPEIEQISDFHCVEGWGLKNVRWKGVQMAELIKHVQPKANATHITFYSLGGVYTESLSLAEASEEQTLLAYGLYGNSLPARQGYPLRVIIPRMFGYKGAKWVYRIEFTDNQHLGYWEKYGYNVDGVTQI